MPTPVQQKTRGGGQTDTQVPADGKDPQKTQNNQKPKTYTETTLTTAQDQSDQEIKETAPRNLTGILPQKFTPKTEGVRTEQLRSRG